MAAMMISTSNSRCIYRQLRRGGYYQSQLLSDVIHQQNCQRPTKRYLGLINFYNSTSPPHTKNYRTSSTMRLLPYPRAAVAVTVQCIVGNRNHYLLIQRGKEPDKGFWSLPGGSIKLGEGLLEAAQRELSEETKIEPAIVATNREDGDDLGTFRLTWYPGGAFTTSDAIFRSSSNKDTVEFHYLIAQCFAQLVVDGYDDKNTKNNDNDDNRNNISDDGGDGGRRRLLPNVYAADDADDAKWWTLEEIMDNQEDTISSGVDEVILRAESLQEQGLLVRQTCNRMGGYHETKH